MWLSNWTNARTLIFDLGERYELSTVDIWNYNSLIDLERCTKDFEIFVSTDGVNYASVGNFELSAGTRSLVPSLLTEESSICM